MKAAATNAEVSDLWGKLHKQLPNQRRVTYKGMLQVAMADNFVDPSERKLCEQWRVRHKIKRVEHDAIIAELGWTPSEYKLGTKELVGVGGNG